MPKRRRHAKKKCKPRKRQCIFANPHNRAYARDYYENDDCDRPYLPPPICGYVAPYGYGPCGTWRGGCYGPERRGVEGCGPWGQGGGFEPWGGRGVCEPWGGRGVCESWRGGGCEPWRGGGCGSWGRGGGCGPWR